MGIGLFWKTNPKGLKINLPSDAGLTLCVNPALPKDYPRWGYLWTKIRDNKTTLGGKTLAPYAPIIRIQLKPNRQNAFAQQQALRLCLLARQALEQSDNPAKRYTQTATPKGWSLKMSTYRRLKMMINQNHQSSYPQRKPLGLAFWQGRRWSKATTLPKYAARGNP